MEGSKRNFDSQLEAYFGAIKHAIKEEHTQYLRAHPQLRQILNDLLSSCLLEQPEDVYGYARKYFGYFDYQKDVVTYHPLVLSGCSGAGKGTLATYLLTTHPTRFQFSISYTTRRPRQGEMQGRQYYFVTKEQFEREIAKGVFLQHAEVHGNYYGTHKGKLKEIMARGRIALLDIDVKGAQIVHANDIPCNYLFVSPPSFEVLQQRLRARASDSEESIQKRLNNAKEQSATGHSLQYYGHLVNDTKEKLFADCETYLRTNYKGFL